MDASSYQELRDIANRLRILSIRATNASNSGYRTYCIIGDGESAEGSIWEALSFAGHYKLDNLVAIFDINRLGQRIEDSDNWHGKPLGDKAPAAIEALEKQMVSKGPWKLSPQRPEKEDAPPVDISNIRLSEPPNYKIGEKVATRLAYGVALAKLGANNSRVIAMDGDTKNSTFSDKFKKAHPDRFIECFIAEQNLVGVAIGCGCRGRTVPFASTFAAFFTRAFDQLRMGAISQANIKCAGSHAGISIGEDGPSQMALEDLAMFRSIPNSVVFYPSDAVSCERACELAANYKGIVFIRTSRPNTAVIYPNDEKFEIGRSKYFSALGGIGDAVRTAVAMERDIVVKHLAVRNVPRSGPSAALLNLFEIDAEHIVKAVHEVLKV
ncbi:hypothetical protein HPB52_010067 [Rhipicephalus sanguineus]|uniref:Transketolase-like pyrimidine-binding domain-containing protein n=1 Tax=Rhipicephalus sanguineus TaxID=34632 RepID=A0A9D4SSW5_RHISA|nr:hypothetical protein HPB52_010067 [Rhipicephalus sanguineus]